MEKCLVFEKDLRLVPEDALNHQWFFIRKEHVDEKINLLENQVWFIIISYYIYIFKLLIIYF